MAGSFQSVLVERVHDNEKILATAQIAWASKGHILSIVKLDSAVALLFKICPLSAFVAANKLLRSL